MTRVGPRKVCGPPTWLPISLMTSAARRVLSSTNPPTRSAGRIMSIANPQTTMSFTPMDRDLIRDCRLDCNIEKSLTELPPYRRLLCIVKYMIGEVLVYITTQVSAIYSKTWHFQPRSIGSSNAIPREFGRREPPKPSIRPILVGLLLVSSTDIRLPVQSCLLSALSAANKCEAK